MIGKLQMLNKTCACGNDFTIKSNSLRKTCFICSPFHARDRSRIIPHNKGHTNHHGYIDAQGYIRVYFPQSERPLNAPKRSHYLEHTLVMQRKLGRFLLPGENIHHINGNKTDNRPENLELWVVHQPKGQRPEDLINWAEEILARYSPRKAS